MDLTRLLHLQKIGEEPFRSLTALPDEEALRVMRSCYVEGSVFWERFADPAWYLQARRQTEEWLYRQFCAKGGRPEQPYPVYMILGKGRWASNHIDPATAATTRELWVPFDLFGEDDLSFTYPDSMVSSLVAYQKDPAYYNPDLHGRIFTLAELREKIARDGCPDEGWSPNLPDWMANYIECQVWNRSKMLAWWENIK